MSPARSRYGTDREPAETSRAANSVSALPKRVFAASSEPVRRKRWRFAHVGVERERGSQGGNRRGLGRSEAPTKERDDARRARLSNGSHWQSRRKDRVHP